MGLPREHKKKKKERLPSMPVPPVICDHFVFRVINTQRSDPFAQPCR